MSFKSNFVVALFVCFFLVYFFFTVAACDCLKNLAPEIRPN